MQLRSTILGLLTFGVSLTGIATEYQDLQPFNAEYVAYRFGDDVGTANLELKQLDDVQYTLTYRSKVSKFFLSDKRYEHSLFALDAGAIKPIEYHYKRSGTGPDKKLSVKFDKQSSKINIDDNKTLPWQNEFDNQLFRIDIPRKLALGETSMEYQFVNYRGELREYKIEFVANEQLDLPYGMLDSVKLKINRESKTRQTYAWFSPSLDYALVRLQQFKDGDEQGDIKLKSFQKTTL